MVNIQELSSSILVSFDAVCFRFTIIYILQLTTLFRNDDNSSSAWGGKHYKSEDRKKPIMMGQWDMIQVMKRISNHLSPTVVGIRMPVFFETKEFLHQLKDSDISVHGVDVKKAGPQIFIILSI